MHFSFDFGWYSIHLDIVRKEQRGGGGVGGGLLNGQNLLSVTKAICQQSLIYIYSRKKKIRICKMGKILLNGQNLLSVTKAICQQSLIYIYSRKKKIRICKMGKISSLLAKFNPLTTNTFWIYNLSSLDIVKFVASHKS